MHYGVDLETQNKKLREMLDECDKMRAGENKAKLPFQNGIIISTNSLMELREYVLKKYGINFILTHRLNQDVLENFFSQVRGAGGTFDHPTSLEFKHRLRLLILGKNPGALSAAVNSTEPNQRSGCSNDERLQDNEEACLTTGLFDAAVSADVSTENESELPPEDIIEEGICFQGDIADEALTYLAGYVAFRLRKKYYDLGVPTAERLMVPKSSWV